MDMTELLRLLGLRQAYDAYQRNIGQPVANVAGPFGRGFLGLQQPEYGSEQAYRTGQAVGNMPGPNVPAGAIKMAAQVPGLLDAIQAAKNSPELTGLLGLTAYHGSPYRFSKFDPTKIGTGEGAQAYGYGTYFAEAPGVAREYQMALGGKAGEITTIDGKPVGQLYEQISRKADRLPADQAQVEYQKLEMLDKIMLDTSPDELIKYARDIEANPAVIKWLETEIAPKTKFPGAFYTVDIPDEMIGRMLDWDKPLSQQPKVVQEFLSKVSFNPPTADQTIGEWLKPRLNEGMAPYWSEDLRKAGIPGIKYLDQGSRTEGKGTRNFVVFPGEEEAIKMLKVE